MNWTGRIASIFVKNSRLSLLLVIALFSWGFISFLSTPKQYNPQITAPSFQISVNFPGASKKEALEQVTKPLENIISDIPGVDDIFSYTSKGAYVTVNVNFEVGRDFDSAKITLNDRINSNFDRKPLGIDEPLVKSVDPEDIPVLTIVLTSDEVDPIKLRKFGFLLRDQLRTIEGASNIEVIGGRKRELAIEIDPLILKKKGVGINAIENALMKSNLYLPSGTIKTSDKYISLEASGIVENPDDLKNIVVVTGDYGQIYLKDIAKIREKTEEVENYIRHLKKVGSSIKEFQSPVLLSVAKLKGTNITEVTDRISGKLNYLKKKFVPKNIKTEIIVNEGDIAKKEIFGLIQNLFTSILIVVIILLLFLDLRAALLVAISIPLTLASVFGIGYVTGQNINRITLFALILSLGLLVDSATVVIENIVRRMRIKKSDEDIKTVVISAVDEVGMGLFMSTVTTVLAFFPMAFVTGMMGPYMGPIPFFLPAALILSLLLAYSVNPWMATVFLKKRKNKKKNTSKHIHFIITLFRAVKNFIKNIFDKYHNYLHRLLYIPKQRKIFIISILILVILSISLPAFKLVKFRMLPKADREQFFVYVDLPAGSTLNETLKATKKIENFLLKNKNIVMTQSYIGHSPILDFNGLFRGVESRMESFQSTIRVGLNAPETRNIKSETIVFRIRPELLKEVKKISGKIKIKLVEDPPGPPVLSTFLVRVQGENEELINKIATDIHGEINKIDQVVDTDTSVVEDTKTISVKINSEKAFVRRISTVQIIQALNTAYNGKVLGIYHNKNNIEQEYITLKLAEKFRKDKKYLNDIYLFNERGIEIPLKEMVTFVSIDTEKPLRRENRCSTAYVYGDMGERSVTYAAIDFLFYIYNYKVPGHKSSLKDFSLFGASFELDNGKIIKISLGGEWELTLEVFRDLGIAMAIAVFLIYFVLVAQFGSFREPVIIMSTIPLSLIGVLPGFMILGFTSNQYFSATSMIGVIALAGIAVNNSIILLEYLNSLKNKGISLEDALLESAHIRFRPIMLTTITTMLGSLTIANDPVWSGLAYSIFFGLAISSLLTLLVFPVMYYLLKGKNWK